MTKLLSLAAFAAGLVTVGWIGSGYLTSHFLALCITLLIAAFYLVGAQELRRFAQHTAGLAQALQGLTATPQRLEDWLAQVPQALRGPVRQRVEGMRQALPGPVLTPYLTGLLVLLGMLGTFGGMVVALNGTGVALAGAEGLAAIREALSTPVQGLGLAFGTSVAGVAASAMLGLMGALWRRERLGVAQQLDAALVGPLRPFSPEHQREAQLRLLEQQSALWPQVVEGIQACMSALERQQQALNERLGNDQARFFEHTATAYGGLAASVEKALGTSAADSAQRAAQAIQPAIESALAGLASESTRLQAAMAQEVRGQLGGWAEQLGAATASVSSQWTQALDTHQRNSEATTRALAEALAQATQGLEQRTTAWAHTQHAQWTAHSEAQEAQWQHMLEAQARASEALVQRQAQALEQAGAQLAQSQQAVQQQLDASTQQRQAQWMQALESTATALQTAWQHQQAQAGAQWQQVGEALARSAAEVEAGAQNHIRALMGAFDARATEDDAQRSAWREALQAQAQQLQQQWQQAADALVAQQHQASTTLAQAASAVQQQAEAQAQRVLAQLESRASHDDQRLADWRAALQAQASALHTEWQQAAQAMTAEHRAVGEQLARTATAMGAQAEAQVQRLLAQVEQRTGQDEQRLQAWTQTLQAQTAALQQEWQQAGQVATAQQQAVGEALARTATAMGAQTEAQVERLLAQVEQRTGQDEQRLQAWTQTLQAQTAALQQEWQQAGQVATAQQQSVSDALSRTAQEMAQSLQAQAQATVGEVARLVEVASEAPRAAAAVIGELREKLSDSMVRDNAVLEERSRMLQTLSTLLDGVNHAAQEQRGAIDALVSTSASLMEQASQQFAHTLQSQSGVLGEAATQVQAGAMEVASLGEAFAAAVDLFGQNNTQLLAQLQGIETAMGKSLKRSDEQLEYYVAQAREVIELSIGAQKQVMDGLQHLAPARAEAGAA